MNKKLKYLISLSTTVPLAITAGLPAIISSTEQPEEWPWGYATQDFSSDHPIAGEESVGISLRREERSIAKVSFTIANLATSSHSYGWRVRLANRHTGEVLWVSPTENIKPRTEKKFQLNLPNPITIPMRDLQIQWTNRPDFKSAFIREFETMDEYGNMTSWNFVNSKADYAIDVHRVGPPRYDELDNTRPGAQFIRKIKFSVSNVTTSSHVYGWRVALRDRMTGDNLWLSTLRYVGFSSRSDFEIDIPETAKILAERIDIIWQNRSAAHNFAYLHTFETYDKDGTQISQNPFNTRSATMTQGMKVNDAVINLKRV